jgi:hypothetical protein
MTHADDYPIVIRRNSGGYVAEASALGLTRSGPDVSVLEADIRAAVGEILAVCDKHQAKIQTVLKDEPAATRYNSPYRRSIAGAMIVLLAVVVISLPLMWGLQRASNFMSSSFQNLNTSQVLNSISSGIQKTADTLEAITPQRRDQLAKDFGRIAQALEPYAAQIRPLLVPAPAGAQPVPGDRRP